MSDLLPERVDTSNVIALRDQADAVVVWAATTDDAEALWDNSRRAAALERYVDDAETERRLRRARGWTMTHLGRALKDGDGQGTRTDLPARGKVDVPANRAHEARTLRRWALDEPDPEVVAALDAGLAIKPILRLIAERTPVVGGGEILEGKRWRIIAGDFRTELDGLPDQSIDLILTDPPYPTEYLPLYSDLAVAARRLLKPRGLLLVVTGQINLPEVVGRLGEHLRYGWCFVLDMIDGGGGLSRIMGRHLIQTWKPILAYSVGPWPSGEWRADRVISPAKDQATFAWGQSVPPAISLIESYCPPDAIVLDPFTGGGAYGEAALRAGRRFLGVEMVPAKHEQAAERLSGVER